MNDGLLIYEIERVLICWDEKILKGKDKL